MDRDDQHQVRPGTRFQAATGKRVALAAACVLVWAAVAVATGSDHSAFAQQAPTPNPEMSDSCGTNVALVLDASGSVEQAHAVDDVREAAGAFLDALADTGSTARVLQFATLSEQLAAQAEVTQASVRPGGVFREALDDYYNPKPPRPGNVNIYSYDGSGNAQSSSNWRSSNGSDMYTNWDQSLDQAGDSQPLPIELVLYVTDGDPTAYDFNQPGDPFDAGPPPDVGVNTDRGDASQHTMSRAIAEANLIKSGGARMLAVGVGSALDNSSSANRLVQIAGPQVARDGDLGGIDSINDIDVALVRDFDRLASFLRAVVSELCSPSLSIRKLAQTPESAEYLPAAGWDLTVSPSVTNGSWGWILPDTDPAALPTCGNPTNPDDQAPRTCTTNASGLANFQWEPDPETAPTTAVVSETLEAGYTAGRPDAPDWRCQVKDIDGNVDIEEGDFAGAPQFTLDVDSQDIITCSIYNSLDYAPSITLTKEDTPTQVRGDLGSPGGTVTSTFVVTNTSPNAVLSDVALTDDQCAPVGPAVDAGGDGVLSIGESWTYACTRTMTGGGGTAPDTVDNHARVTARDPAGTAVEALADDSVIVYQPGIALEKTATPLTIPVGPPQDVTYTYVATNTGNMPLNDITVVDDDPAPAASCSPITPASVATLAPGDSATFTCTTQLTADDADDTFVNNAAVTGTPDFPVIVGETPGPTGPDVTADASAIVAAVDPDITLSKSVTPSVVLPGQSVTYTYVVTNDGDEDITPVGADANGQDNWVDDTLGPQLSPLLAGTCTDVLYDAANSTNPTEPTVLNVGESWTYTCTATIPGGRRNVVDVARVLGTAEGGATVRAFAIARVRVVTPRMSIDKVRVRAVVLDPGAPAIEGPDVAASVVVPRPAQFEYTLRNTGEVPVRNLVVTDTNVNPGHPGCALSGPTGDIGGDDILDVGEVWGYSCSLDDGADGPRLSKSVGDTPVDPTQPATVTNTVTASGEGFIPNTGQALAVPEVSDVAAVDVISPQLTLQKTPCVAAAGGGLTCDANPDDADDLRVRAGAEVTYRYHVTNTGDSPLLPVSGADSRCDGFTLIGGDLNLNGLIDQAEVWEWQCTAIAGFPTPVTNDASILVSGPLGNLYQATDSARIRIFDPAIALVKSVSDDFVPAGSTVTYTFEVTNAGTIGTGGLPADLVLAEVTLRDVSRPANPSCTIPTAIGGDTDDDELLDLLPAETWTYTCTGVVNETTVDVAGVTADAIDGLPVFAFDSAIVTPYDAGIAIVKSATPRQLISPGGPVTYTYLVSNTGNVPLSNVSARISDNTCAPVTYVQGDDDGNQLLTGETDLFETGPQETWTFTCTTTVTQPTTNVVTVTGTPVNPAGPETLGPDVTDNDTAFVDVIAPEPGPPAPSTTTTTSVAPLPPLPPTGGAPMGAVFIGLVIAAAGVVLVHVGRYARGRSH